MIAVLWTAAVVWAVPAGQPCAPPAGPYLVDLAENGDPTSAQCLVDTDGFIEPLVQAIRSTPATDPAHARYTVALALHLAARAETPWNREHVELLSEADRALLADAVRARRGRKSVANDALFQNQPWYRVDTRYSDNLLAETEWENLALIEPSAVREPVAVVTPGAEPPATPSTPEGCGCNATPIGGAGVALIAALGLARRRRSP